MRQHLESMEAERNMDKSRLDEANKAQKKAEKQHQAVMSQLATAESAKTKAEQDLKADRLKLAAVEQARATLQKDKDKASKLLAEVQRNNVELAKKAQDLEKKNLVLGDETRTKTEELAKSKQRVETYKHTVQKCN